VVEALLAFSCSIDKPEEEREEESLAGEGSPAFGAEAVAVESSGSAGSVV